MRILSAGIIVLVPILFNSVSLASDFIGLGDFSGGVFESRAFSVSSDGLVVVGKGSGPYGQEAFRWTRANGMVGLGDLVGPPFQSFGFAVSTDGSVVIGVGRNSIGSQVKPFGSEAFRWSNSGGMVGLGDLVGGQYGSSAYGVSADGSVVVGESHGPNGTEAYRWTMNDGMVGLGDFEGSGFQSIARDVSADGLVVVGIGTSALGNEAFRWTESSGIVGLGDLEGGSFASRADAISSNGMVIVGVGSTEFGDEAFRWTQNKGIIRLGAPHGGSSRSYYALAVSADGSVIVGTSYEGNGIYKAIIWDENNGTRYLHQILTHDHGIDLSEWILNQASGLSDDGRTIVGFGTHNGNVEAFVANLGVNIPEPGSIALHMGVFIIFARIIRRYSCSPRQKSPKACG